MMTTLPNNRHHRAVKALGYTLTLQDQPEAWVGLDAVFRARLTEYERACLLATAAAASETSALASVCEQALPAHLAGPPLPVLDQIEDDARWWADMATVPELRAWLAACFVRLPAREQQEFLVQAKGRAAA